MFLYEENYLNYLKSLNLSESSIKHKRAGLKEFRNFIIENENKDLLTKDIEKIFTKERILRYFNYLRLRKSKRKGFEKNNLKLKTIIKKLSALKSYLNYLLLHRKIISNPFDLIDLPVFKKELRIVDISEEDIKKIVRVINTDTYIGFRDRVIIELIYSTGLRRSEVVNLSIYDINLNDDILKVREGKGKKDRLVPLGKVIKNYLKEYMINVRKYLLSLENMYSEILFLSVNGKKIREDKLGEIIKDYVKKSGVDKKITAHSLRHAFAIHMMRKGCDIRYIQELLGHKSLETTIFYTSIVDNDLREKILKYHPRDNELYDEKELYKLKMLCLKKPCK